MTNNDDFMNDEPMTPAELVVITGWLGLDQRALAEIVGVSERSVRRWTQGTHPIPEGIREQIENLEAFTAGAVEELVDALCDARDLVVAIYRTSEEMWVARPEFEPYPAGWWRQVVARAVHEVPGVTIVFTQPNTH